MSPEQVRDGAARLSEEARREQKALEEARLSLRELVEHESKRRRNRLIFLGALLLCALLVLPLIALYVALIVKLALTVA